MQVANSEGTAGHSEKASRACRIAEEIWDFGIEREDQNCTKCGNEIFYFHFDKVIAIIEKEYGESRADDSTDRGET